MDDDNAAGDDGGDRIVVECVNFKYTSCTLPYSPSNHTIALFPLQ